MKSVSLNGVLESLHAPAMSFQSRYYVPEAQKEMLYVFVCEASRESFVFEEAGILLILSLRILLLWAECSLPISPFKSMTGFFPTSYEI